jgi:hypothetical protein
VPERTVVTLTLTLIVAVAMMFLHTINQTLRRISHVGWCARRQAVVTAVLVLAVHETVDDSGATLYANAAKRLVAARIRVQRTMEVIAVRLHILVADRAEIKNRHRATKLSSVGVLARTAVAARAASQVNGNTAMLLVAVTMMFLHAIEEWEHGVKRRLRVTGHTSTPARLEGVTMACLVIQTLQDRRTAIGIATRRECVCALVCLTSEHITPRVATR